MRRRQGYPSQSYRRLYEPAVGPLWSADAGLAPEENGDHYSRERDFFEWWYFDAILDNGYRLVAILHSSLYNAVDHKPTVDVRLTGPSGMVAVAIGRYTRSDYAAATDHCDVRIAGCHVMAESTKRYRVRLHQDGVASDLVYEGQVPGWQAGTGYLFADDATGHFFKWVVPLPRAIVRGTLTVGSHTQSVKGLGYHDHNWGNLVLADAFSHWYWGRIFADEGSGTVVFGDVVGHEPDPVHVTPLLFAPDGQVQALEPIVSFDAQNPSVEPITGLWYPTCLNLQAFADKQQFLISLRTTGVIEALDFASPPFRHQLPRQLAETAFYLSAGKPFAHKLVKRFLGKASYLRLQADAWYEITNAHTRRSGRNGIFEIMRFH